MSGPSNLYPAWQLYMTSDLTVVVPIVMSPLSGAVRVGHTVTPGRAERKRGGQLGPVIRSLQLGLAYVYKLVLAHPTVHPPDRYALETQLPVESFRHMCRGPHLQRRSE